MSAACARPSLQVERPLYLIFLLVAGALWDPRAWQGWLLAPVFVLSRVGGKLIGAHVAKRNGPADLPDAGTLGLALAAQSPIAIATIVSYVTLYKAAEGANAALPWLMTACIGGAVLTEHRRAPDRAILSSREMIGTSTCKTALRSCPSSRVSISPPTCSRATCPPGAQLARFPLGSSVSQA